MPCGTVQKIKSKTLKSNVIYSHIKRINFVGKNVTKYVQDLYAEKYKAVIKKSKKI